MRPDPVTAGPSGVIRTVTGEPGTPAGPDGFDVETVGRIEAVDSGDWDAAVDAQRLPVFYSRAFLSAYERHPLTAIDGVAYLLVRRRGRPGPPVAVLPAYLQHRPDAIGHLAGPYPEAADRPALLAHCWHCYDGDVAGAAVTPGLAAAVMAALRRLAGDLGASSYGLLNVRRDGGTARALTATGLPTRPLSERYGADLGGLTGVDDFLERNVAPKVRANLRRHRRRAADHGVRAEALPVERADLPGISALCNRLAGRYSGPDRYYPPGRFERFLAALGPAALVIEVREGRRLVAGCVCLLDDERLHWWAGGADYEVAGNFSPYYVMFAETVELALRLGRRDLEGGRGNPRFKLRHGLVARPLDACVLRA
jgi:predicted N-acyltransferase